MRLKARGMKAREAIDRAEYDDQLRAALDGLPCKAGSSKSLGRYLTSVRERVVAGRRFVPADDGHGTLVWSAVRVEGPLPDPEGDAPGDDDGIDDERRIDVDGILATMLDEVQS